MKQTKIKYQLLADGKIKIVAIENVATMDEIGKEFGNEVERLYWNSDDCYRLHDNVCFISNRDNRLQMKVGSLIEKEQFSVAVTGMKKAAARLIEIRQKVAEYEVKEIVI